MVDHILHIVLLAILIIVQMMPKLFLIIFIHSSPTLIVELHDLLENLFRVHAHLFSNLKDLGVKLIVVDIVKVDLFFSFFLLVFLVGDVLLATAVEMMILRLLVIGNELLVHFKLIIIFIIIFLKLLMLLLLLLLL